MYFLLRIFAWTLTVGAAASPGWAQTALPAGEPGARVSLHAATESAWQRSVLAREATAQRRGADAARTAASSLWAKSPAVELAHRGDSGAQASGRRESEVGLSWPLWLPGQQAARQAAASMEEQVAQETGRALKLRLAGEVREQAWGLQMLKAELEQVTAQQQSLQELAADVDRRVKAGDLARADAMAARAEVLAAAAVRSEVGQRLADSRARWRVLTGQALDPDPVESPVPEPAGLADAHPELRLAARKLEHSRRKLDLVQHSRREAPEVSVSYRHDQGGAGQGEQGSVGVKLRLPFGTEDRNLPLEAAAQGELEIAEAAAQRLQEQQTVAMASARQSLRSAQERLDAERERAGLLAERAQLMKNAFQAGEAALPELLRAIGAASQAQASLTRQEAALGLARARYQQALGVLP